MGGGDQGTTAWPIGALGVLVTTAAIWGGAFIFLRVTAPVLGPAWTPEVRVLLGGLALLVWFRLAGLEGGLWIHRRAYLVVTHDRRLLDRVAEEIVELENGRLTAYSGGYSAYRRQKAERVLSATRAFEKQQEFIEKEKEYIRRNIAGVNSRQAKGRRTRLARVDLLEKPADDRTSVAFQFDAARIGGRSFLRARNLDAGYAPGAPVVGDIDAGIGEMIAMVDSLPLQAVSDAEPIQ